MFKDSVKSRTEERIKRAISSLIDDGFKLTEPALKKRLVRDEGIDFLCKSKEQIRVVMSMPNYVDTRRDITADMDPSTNMRNIHSMLKQFDQLLTLNSKSSRQIRTTHSACQDLTNKQMRCLILTISLLPWCWNRLNDGLPCLFFYGKSRQGKSYIFNKSPCYKMVPTDATGVGRFRLEQTQAAFLIDDVKNDWLQRSDNESTIRTLADGNEVTVKIAGDVQVVRGWVVITSNSVPHWLDSMCGTHLDPNEQYHKDAMERRFIHIDCQTSPDYLHAPVDLHTEVASFVAYKYLSDCEPILKDTRVYSMLQPYFQKLSTYANDKFEQMYTQIISETETE
jgi:hypothetical protein